MSRRREGAMVLFVAILLGCGARTEFADEFFVDASSDSVVVVDGAVDTHPDTTPPPFDAVAHDAITVDAVPPDTSSTFTVGDPCKRDVDCDKDGTGTHKCTTDLSPGYGNFDPLPVCVATGCDFGDSSSVMPCDGDRGICLNAGSSGLCLPKCTFTGDGSKAIGCAGNDACNVFTWSFDASGKQQGIGYCFGGCTDSFRCNGGDSCQIETGECLVSPVKYTKKLGEACTDADTTSGCDCLYPSTTNKGYCTSYCRVGESSCPSGFVCTTYLPASTFAKSPTGIAGSCLRTCASDGDCAGLSSTCQTTPDGKVCLPFSLGG